MTLTQRITGILFPLSLAVAVGHSAQAQGRLVGARSIEQPAPQQSAEDLANHIWLFAGDDV